MSRGSHRPFLAAFAASVATLASFGTGSALAGGDIYIPDTETYKIPDKGKGALKLKVDVQENGTINNMFVGFRAEHPQTKDLKLSLKSPDGIKTVMSNRDTKGPNLGDPGVGCGGNPTIFSAQSMNDLSSGSAPYAGSFAPEQSFDVYDGEQTEGKWTLTIKDQKQGNKGELLCNMLSFYTNP